MNEETNPLAHLIAQWLQAVERGELPDREALIRENPVYEEGLRKFFADYERLKATDPQPVERPVPKSSFTQIPIGDPQPGTVIGGRYKLIENIGEGGMGSVWVAEQKEPVKRKVAIKLIKPGMDSKQVLARFEAERQALALMNHPNIASVFDGGMYDQGRPFFVMEYVKGIPFTKYCDQARLSLKERLELFIPVCQAVQHAHHKGIVHRDLKPSNILICLYDGLPVPKVIDFGLAKAMHQPLTDMSLHTAHGIMVGTPLYMSPEQAELNNLDVDTRTDVYALGVVLYELLTGTTPLERKKLCKAAAIEILRLIREVEPLRPSTRLGGSASLPSIAAQRNIDPKLLQKSLSGDLDWIEMKALEKERTRRYETATSLARDVERFLNEEPVEACPPSQLYRLKKFIRKNKPQVVAAGIVFSGLMIAVGGLAWGWKRSNEAAETVRQSLANVTRERDAKNEALTKESAALKAESAQREQAERRLCEGILRPIGYGYRINESELRAFVDWAALSDHRMKLKVLKIAIEDPETALRVARRSDRALQACVTISPTRRAAALKLFAEKQRDKNAHPAIRTAACWLTMELDGSDLPGLRDSILWLKQPNITREESHPFLAEYLNRLTSHITLLRNTDTEIAWDTMIDDLAKDTDPLGVLFRSKDLTALALRLDAGQVTRAWDAQINVLASSTDQYALRAVSTDLVALVPHLNAEQMMRAGETLIDVLPETTNYHAREAAGMALVAMAPRLEAGLATRAGNTLIDMLGTTTDTDALKSLSEAVVTLAPRLEAGQVTRAGDTLIDLLTKMTNSKALEAVGKALVALAPRLEAEQMMRAGEVLIDVLPKTTDAITLVAVSETLVMLAPRLDTGQRIRVWDTLIDMLGKTTDTDALKGVSEAVVTLAPRLEAGLVTRAWDTLIDMLGKTTDSDALKAASQALVALAPRLEAGLVTRAGDTLIDLLGKTTDPDTLHVLGEALVALAPRLDAVQVTRAWDTLIDVLGKMTEPNALREVGKAWTALAPRLDASQSLRAGNTLIDVLGKTTDPDTRHVLGEALVALAPRLDAVQVTRAWDTLIDLLVKTTGYNALRVTSEVLVALAPRLEVGQVARAGDTLIDILAKTGDPDAPRAAGDVLVALSLRMSQKDRLKAVDVMLASLYHVQSEGLSKQIYTLPPPLALAQRTRITIELQSFLLDCYALSEDYFKSFDFNFGYPNRFDSFEHSARLFHEPRSFAQFFRHPGCIGEPREYMLQRLEELIFHKGESVYLFDTSVSGKSQDKSSTTSQPATPPPPRRFRSIHDAAGWIQKNWPDFDLETTMPVMMPAR